MEKIAEKHGELHIASKTAANNAVKGKFKNIWVQLKSKPYVRSLELELFALICTLYPEDFRIPIEDLIAFGMGINLFKDVRDIVGARDRVHHLVDIINSQKKTELLLLEKDEYNNEYIRMAVHSHARARRDSKFEFELVSKSDNFAEGNSYKSCYGLSVVALREICEHPTNWNYPKLALLLLKYRTNSQCPPVCFFQGLKKLRVLSLDVLSLPQSLEMLRNLRVLRLKVLKLKDLSLVGGLVNLEFLTISTTCLIDIPKEMGQLGNLRLLDLRKVNLGYIPPGVLSKLLKLEELYFPLSFRRWGSRVREEADDYDESEPREEDDCGGEERINASLNEISTLLLNALQIYVPKASMMCNKSPIIKSIQRFKFFVQNELNCQLFVKSSTNELQLTGDVCDIKESGICDLIRKTEDLSLIQVRNLKNIIYQLEDSELLHLKKMIITECDELQYLVDTPENRLPDSPFLELRILHLSMLSNLKEIWNGTSRNLLYRWFLNLTEIKIRFCHKLKYVFPLSIGRGLIRLKSIEILDCSELEGIFYRNTTDDNTNGIYLVEKLYLFSLPRFVGFLVQRDSTIDGDCVDANQSLTRIEIVSNGKEGSSAFNGNSQSVSTNESIMRLNGDCSNDELICPAGKLQQSVIQQFVPNKQVLLIKDKDILGSMEMHSAFSSELMNERLIKLRKVKIAFCDALRVIFSFEENHATSIRVLNSLEELELYGLRNLKHIWFQIPQNIMAFQRLRLLTISECHNLYLLTIPIAKLLVQLQKIQISRCEKMEEIIAKDDEKDAEELIDNTVLPRLKALELHHMSGLKIFSSVIHAIELPSLEFLKLNQCIKMELFSYGSLNIPKLKKVHIDGSSYSVIGDLNATLARLKAKAH